MCECEYVLRRVGFDGLYVWRGLATEVEEDSQDQSGDVKWSDTFRAGQNREENRSRKKSGPNQCQGGETQMLYMLYHKI